MICIEKEMMLCNSSVFTTLPLRGDPVKILSGRVKEEETE